MKTILINTGSNMSVTLVKLVITFVMTPVFVHNLGNYDYGIWEILGAVLGYMGLLDIGMKPAISRFAAKYHSEGSHQELSTLYSTSWFFLAIVGVLLFVFFLCWALLLPESLSEDAASQFKYSLLLMIIGAQLLIVFPGYVAESFLEGFQKYYIKNNVTIFNSIMGAIAIYVFIDSDNAILVIAAVNAIGLSIKYLLYTLMLTRPKYGSLRPRISLASLSSLKETTSFGVKSLIQGIASRVSIGTDTIVIGFFLGPAMVPFYAIPANLISYIRNIGWTLTHAFMPLFSSLSAQNKTSEIQEIYLGGSRYIIGLLLPVCVGLTLVGSEFIGVWVGKEYMQSADIIILLLVIFVATPFLNPFSTRYLTAIDEHGLLSKLYPVSALINITLSIALVQDYGIVGVAIGSVVPVFLVVPIVLRACCKHLQLPVSLYIRKSILPSLMPTLVMWLSVYYFKSNWALDGYADIAIAVFIGAVVYVVLFATFGLSQAERQWFISKLQSC